MGTRSLLFRGFNLGQLFLFLVIQLVTSRNERLIVDISGAQLAVKLLWKTLALPQPLQRVIVDFQGMPVFPKNSLVDLSHNLL